MTKFDLHIARRLILGYFGLLGALIIFYIVLHYVEYIDDFQERGAESADVFLRYYPNYIPEIVRLVSPLGLFLSAVHLTGRLAQKLELSTLQTGGVSLYRLMVPYVVVATVLTGVMFWFNGWIVPTTNVEVLRFEQEFTKDGSGLIEYGYIHRQNSPQSVLSVSSFDRTNVTANFVSLQTYDEERRPVERIDSRKMIWVDSTSSWNFLDPVVRKFSSNGRESIKTFSYIDTVLTVFPRDLARSKSDMDGMTIDEGKEYLDLLRRSRANHIGLPLVTYYVKYSYPFANLILVLLGVPLASVRRRGGQAILLGIGLFTAFTYLTVMKLTEPFGYAGDIPPLVAAWLPHILFAGVALIVMIRVRK